MLLKNLAFLFQDMTQYSVCKSKAELEKVKINYSKVESVFMKQFKKEYALHLPVVLILSYLEECARIIKECTNQKGLIVKMNH
jgi:hypothetical protein